MTYFAVQRLSGRSTFHGVQKLSGSKEQCAQLGERAAGLMKHIKKHLDTNSGPISDELKANLEELSKYDIQFHATFVHF